VEQASVIEEAARRFAVEREKTFAAAAEVSRLRLIRR